MDYFSGNTPVSGTVSAPSSKSYAQRAIAAGLLAGGETVLCNIELCSDTEAAIGIARMLGAKIDFPAPGTVSITGGFDPKVSGINVGESGLSARMFTPIASLSPEKITINGTGSILNRPFGMILAPLSELGVRVDSDGFLPLSVTGPLRGGTAHVDGAVSSQFLTGLLMALPLAGTDSTVYVEELKSIPYIEMTLDLLEEFGVRVEHSEFREFYVPGSQRYNARRYHIEGDWSGASCLLVAGAVAGNVTLRNLNPLSKQADVAIIDALSRAGAEVITDGDTLTVKKRELNGFEFDATHCPDLFPALAVLAANCEGKSVIKGTERLVHKESNRNLALREEFEKLGITVDLSQDDTMIIHGGQIMGGEADSHNDHRIAMAVAVAGLTSEVGVTVTGSSCVNKSYPGFWEDLDSIRIGQRIEMTDKTKTDE